MPRKNKIDVDSAKKSEPLAIDAFAALDALDKSQLAPNPITPAPSATPQKPKAAPQYDGRLILRREKKDRGGKTVVIISGFIDIPRFSNAVVVGDLAKKLRGRLGCGGSFDRREIMLQGDRPAEVAAVLRDLGFRVDGVVE